LEFELKTIEETTPGNRTNTNNEKGRPPLQIVSRDHLPCLSRHSVLSICITSRKDIKERKKEGKISRKEGWNEIYEGRKEKGYSGRKDVKEGRISRKEGRKGIKEGSKQGRKEEYKGRERERLSRTESQKDIK